MVVDAFLVTDIWHGTTAAAEQVTITESNAVLVPRDDTMHAATLGGRRVRKVGPCERTGGPRHLQHSAFSSKIQGTVTCQPYSVHSSMQTAPHKPYLS